MDILVFFLVIALLIADAVIFFVAGVVVNVANVIKKLKEEGWKVEPPKEGDKFYEI